MITVSIIIIKYIDNFKYNLKLNFSTLNFIFTNLVLVLLTFRLTYSYSYSK